MSPIYQQLKAHANCFDFSQALQLLEQFYQLSANKMEEVVLFKQKPQLGFAVNDVVAIEMPIDAPATLTVSFMGLAGPQSLLPAHYTEQLLRLLRNKETALADWIHLLEQRPLSFFYRAWRKYHCLEQTTQVTTMLRSLVGCGLMQQKNYLDIADNFYLYYASYFTKSSATTEGLKRLLSDYFSVMVDVQPLQGEWLALADAQCTRLMQAEGAYNQLGVDMMVGNKVWQCQHKFRLVIGPLNTQQLQQFLPQSTSLELLRKIVKRMIGAQLQFDMQLIVKAACVPRWQLSAASSTQLGWTSWLANQPFKNDVNDIILKEKNYEYA